MNAANFNRIERLAQIGGQIAEQGVAKLNELLAANNLNGNIVKINEITMVTSGFGGTIAPSLLTVRIVAETAAFISIVWLAVNDHGQIEFDFS